jgi:hypothetical protein
LRNLTRDLACRFFAEDFFIAILTAAVSRSSFGLATDKYYVSSPNLSPEKLRFPEK